MIKKIVCYTLLCDNCGEDLNNNSEVACWANIDVNYEIAEESGWRQIEGDWYCMNCYIYDAKLDKYLVKTGDDQ